jgi:hypothetical protein
VLIHAYRPVPDLDGPFFLRMKDASGTETSSSVFTLTRKSRPSKRAQHNA